ncbi:hypothetical protein NMG60_11022204 [Bertholletia excelsa]
MRTRFLCVDYFTSSTIEALETLEFLRLQPPHLPPPNPSAFSDLHSFDDVSALSLSLHLEKFPLDGALSKFFSEVLPRSIDVDAEDFRNASSCSGEGRFSERRSSKDRSSADVQTPEQMFDSILQNPLEILKSFCSVDNITPEYHTGNKACPLEDAGLARDQVHFDDSTFPLLEVDEISLGIFDNISFEEELQLIQSIELQLCPKGEEVLIHSRELLGYLDCDILDYLGNHFSPKLSIEAISLCSNFSQEMDLVSVIELSHFEGNSSFQQGLPDDYSFWPDISVSFEETQFINPESSQLLEGFYDSLTVFEAETCAQMFVKNANFRNFNELIVAHELTLVDDSFTSLPIPVLTDCENKWSPHVFVEKMISTLNLQLPSASDGIYLDWHFLEENYSNHDNYSCCWKQVMEINNYDIDFDTKSFDDEVLIFDYVFSSDTTNKAGIEDNKEVLNSLVGHISREGVCFSDLASTKLLNDEFQTNGNGGVPLDVDDVSVLVKPTLPFDDLNFFLNPREATTGVSSKLTVKITDFNPVLSAVSSGDTRVQLQPWDFKLHQVKLSDNFLEPIDTFRKKYLATFKSDIKLIITQYPYLAMDDNALLSLPEEKLMDCIKKTNVDGTLSNLADTITTALVSLCAIKQMAWYLCYYGIHTCYLYADKLIRNLQFLKFRLSFLQSLCEEMQEKAEGDVTSLHPSLSVIQTILQSSVKSSGLKMLIVAEKVFWWSLKKLLSSMQISYKEQKSVCMYASQHGSSSNNDNAFLHLSSRHISVSFPFEKFSIILEYGGPHASSRVLTISQKLVGFLSLHFLKVDQESSSIAKALCEGVNMLQTSGFTTVSLSKDITILLFQIDLTKLEELLNFIPHEGDYRVGSLRAGDEMKAFCMHLPVPCVPLAMEPKQIPADLAASFPDTVVIVNTQNFNFAKEMIISRRSTYQKILALEKQGAQVVERDLKLPVDVIISAAICLVWYDCQNIGKKATAPYEASSCLPLCIESIAANILTLLSFNFSSCIMVFEGESSFHAAVVDSSDELYAAAASLGIDLQVFFSHSSELTEEIILSCITSVGNFIRHTYPKMPESETLAESFLTTFPSINPLSAHAILSLGSNLVEFLGWSYEHRIRAIRKYHVPDDSISLFSTLSRYGEREDSRSAITECSSSVSSAPDSANCYCKTDSLRKTGKHIGYPPKIDKPTNDLFCFELLGKLPDGRLNPPKISKEHDTWAGVEDIFGEIDKSAIAVSDRMFGQKLYSDVAEMNPSEACKQFDSQRTRGTQISDEIKRPSRVLDEELFDPEDIALMNRLGCCLNNNVANLQKDIIGEVIDINDGFPPSEEFSSIAMPETEKDPVPGKLKTARKLSFSGSFPPFPAAAEISSDLNARVSVEDHGECLGEGINRHTGLDFNEHNLSIRHKDKLSEEGSVQNTATSFPRLSFQGKDIKHQGRTLLSNAVQSGQVPQGSPWTIEFLNRIREKSRSRQQSYPHDMSPVCFSYSKKVPKVTKRKSPSILDFYKYQGGNTPGKINGQKRQRQCTKSSTSSKNERTSVSYVPTWTPPDKQARQKLSFSMGGNGGQSKLVWSDKNFPR